MRFGELTAVDDLTLTIPSGEFFAFLGPNAAGKTTTIKMLTGLLKPTSGSIRICGHDTRESPIIAKSLIGYIPDVAVFYEKLTPVEFLRFVGDLYAIPPDETSRRTGDLFDQFGLIEHQKERIENLSHGTCQRLAIAGALLHEPEVIIIDEPMIGLDPIHIRIVKDELRKRASNGTTILMSTHLLNIAEELADRIGIIAHGGIVELGSPKDILANGAGMSLEEIFLDRVESN